MLPLRLFRDRRMSVGSGVVTAAFFVMFGLFFLFTQYLQFVRDYSPLSAGLATLPLALTLVAVAPRSAALAERLGSGTVIAIGFTLVAAGFFVLGTIGTDTAYVVIAVAMALLGAGMSLTAAPATASIMSAVPPAKAGVGSAVNDTTREVGGALGIAVLGSVASAAFRSSLDVGGLNLPPAVAEQAKESVGAAMFIARGLPNGAELAGRAGASFTDAFNTVGLVSAGFMLVSAVIVALLYRRKAEADAVAASRPALALVEDAA